MASCLNKTLILAITLILLAPVPVTAAQQLHKGPQLQLVIACERSMLSVVWPNPANSTYFVLQEGMWYVWIFNDTVLDFRNGTKLQLRTGSYVLYVKGVRLVVAKIGGQSLTIKVITRSEAAALEEQFRMPAVTITIPDILFSFGLGLAEGLLVFPMLFLIWSLKERREGDAHVV